MRRIIKVVFKRLALLSLLMSPLAWAGDYVCYDSMGTIVSKIGSVDGNNLVNSDPSCFKISNDTFNSITQDMKVDISTIHAGTRDIGKIVRSDGEVFYDNLIIPKSSAELLTEQKDREALSQASLEKDDRIRLDLSKLDLLDETIEYLLNRHPY